MYSVPEATRDFQLDKDNMDPLSYQGWEGIGKIEKCLNGIAMLPERITINSGHSIDNNYVIDVG
eukprot:10823254-Karenia_brevis.AAC.1